MLSRSPRQASVLLAALLLAAALAPFPAAASPPSAGGPQVQLATAGGFDLIGGLRQLLGRIWPQAGCLGDPNGECLTRPSVRPGAGRLHPNAGCLGDPDGGSNCTSSAPQRRAPRS
ncbi:MAG TPA: hypothetical protein VJA16_11705 [Thermoanaerobaculia bacterium]